jgi:hypothetical protein
MHEGAPRELIDEVRAGRLDARRSGRAQLRSAQPLVPGGRGLEGASMHIGDIPSSPFGRLGLAGSERRTTQRRNKKMNDTKQSSEDLAILEQLNKDFFHSDQFSDAKRFSEFLAEDFISQFPGVTRNRAEFLDYIAQPRPFKDLAMHDVNIRILSDVALIHGRATYTMLADGAQQEALYTDTYQEREGTWVCVAACAIAPGA